MIIYTNECCGCAVPGYPCIGNACSLRKVAHLYCDKCGIEDEKLYDVDGIYVCGDCLPEMFDTVAVDDF